MQNTPEIERALKIAERLDADMAEATAKAWDALARYKFLMFGYWAAIWVHLNRIQGDKKASPFSMATKLAKNLGYGAIIDKADKS